MSKRLVVIAVLGVLTSVVLGALVASGSPVDEHDQPFPEHPHVLVLGVELDPVTELPISIKKCVDLAANRALPLNAHHVHVHFGTLQTRNECKLWFRRPRSPESHGPTANRY